MVNGYKKQMMHHSYAVSFWILLFLLLGVHPKAQAQPIAIPVSIYADVLADYHSFLDGRNPVEIKDYSGDKARRDVIEVVLFQQALALGGLDASLEMRVLPTYLRTQKELRKGSIAATTTTLWLNDLEQIKDAILITDALVEEGMFEAGLYTSTKNTKALNAKTIHDVRQLTAISNRNWRADWETLQALNLKSLTHTQHWEIMVKNVDQLRVDFLLAPFQPTESMQLSVDDVVLMPIPGMKVGLVGSRHFAISKNHPHGHIVSEALAKGLRILRANGIIEKAYVESGFFNQTAKKWERIDH